MCVKWVELIIVVLGDPMKTVSQDKGTSCSISHGVSERVIFAKALESLFHKPWNSVHFIMNITILGKWSRAAQLFPLLLKTIQDGA